MFWIRQEYDVKGNREMLKELKAKGYRFEIDSNGYMVWFKDEFIGGAGNQPRKKHWRHRDADSKMFLFNAVCRAFDHFKSN